MNRLPSKNDGVADWIFMAVIVIASIIGPQIAKWTGKVDSPAEQALEKLVYLETGQEVDYSAHLKKDENGKVVATQVKAKTTKEPSEPFPTTYQK